VKPTWCTFHSICWESRACTCFKHYLLILRRSCTSSTWYIACVLCQLAATMIGVEQSNAQSMQRPLILSKLNGKCIMLVSLYWQRSGFDLGSVQVRFLVDKAALRQAFPQALNFSPVTNVSPMLHSCLSYQKDNWLIKPWKIAVMFQMPGSFRSKSTCMLWCFRELIS
jgi:hypothetical protein